jgi:glycosyltransferase involved in cell wall biosynthesis
MKVLYLNHTSQVSGAERSLVELLASMPDRVETLVACPAGRLADECRARGARVEEVQGTDGSLRLHPVRTPRAVAELAIAGQQVARIARRRRVDIVHANSIRSGLSMAAVAPWCPPVLVHVRDCLPRGLATRLTKLALHRTATAVAANSDWTGAHFRLEGSTTPIRTVYSAIDVERFCPDAEDRSAARTALGAGPGEPLLGVIAQITPWKGQFEAIQILRGLRERFPSAHLALVGEPKFTDVATRYDNVAYLQRLRDEISRHDLDDAVSFLGEREDIVSVMRALDVALVPSWEEPFGRVVAEAMAVGTVVVATEVGGPAEIIDDNVSGLLASPGDIDAWVAKVTRVLADDAFAERLRLSGRTSSIARFSRDSLAGEVLSLYEEVLDSS